MSGGIGFGVGNLPWAFEVTPGTLALFMATATETKDATTSASAAVTVTLDNKYIKISGVQVTAASSTQANPSYTNVVASETLPNTVDINNYDQSNARIATPVSITVTGVRA